MFYLAKVEDSQTQFIKKLSNFRLTPALDGQVNAYDEGQSEPNSRARGKSNTNALRKETVNLIVESSQKNGVVGFIDLSDPDVVAVLKQYFNEIDAATELHLDVMERFIK